MATNFHADLVAEGRTAGRSGRGRRIRRAAQLSMSDVARELGVSLDSIQRWEWGVRQPRAEQAVLYALLLRRLEKYDDGGAGP
jgi:DNA-binding transcriptional regulator YiaG